MIDKFDETSLTRNVTRVEVIDYTHKSSVKPTPNNNLALQLGPDGDIHVALSLQDEGRTLKVFISNDWLF